MLRKKRITKKVLLSKSIEILQPILNLDDWKLSVIISRSDKMKMTAHCQAWPEYKLAKLTFNGKYLNYLSHNEIVAVVVHEMIHCVLWEIGNWAEKLSNQNELKLEITRRYEENAVTALEKILIPLVEAHLNKKLKELGYNCVDLTFTDLTIHHYH